MQIDLEVAMNHLANTLARQLAQVAGELAMTATALAAANARIADLEASPASADA